MSISSRVTTVIGFGLHAGGADARAGDDHFFQILCFGLGLDLTLGGNCSQQYCQLQLAAAACRKPKVSRRSVNVLV